jgi:hypothetical protein
MTKLNKQALASSLLDPKYGYTNDTSLLVEEEASFWGLPKEIKLVIGQYVSHV